MAQENIPVHVVTLIEDPESPVLFLYCQGANKIIQVLIGKPEARIMSLVLEKAEFDRPLTHTLILDTIAAMGGELSRIVITDVEDKTFLASLYVKTADRGEVEIDARPSDALILAIQATKPIFVTLDVLMKAGQENPVTITVTNNKKNANGDPQKIAPEVIEQLKDHLQEAQKREQENI